MFRVPKSPMPGYQWPVAKATIFELGLFETMALEKPGYSLVGRKLMVK